MEETWQTLTQKIKQIGYEVSDIQQIVLTHHHVDHCGLMECVRQVSGARTFAHPKAVPYVKKMRNL